MSQFGYQASTRHPLIAIATRPRTKTTAGPTETHPWRCLKEAQMNSYESLWSPKSSVWFWEYQESPQLVNLVAQPLDPPPIAP